ncbi:type 1 glutamine amidotransferase [Nocardioidaceae bacterium]|nr:type 1 glutamine amidotransferase [Nocardioidaceae bacterium]
MDEVRPTVLVVQHEDAVPLRLLGDWLGAEGCDLAVVRPDRGEPLPGEGAPEVLEAYDALVVLGGTMDSWDDAGHPWFAGTRALILAAGRLTIPTLGVCLGHQLAVQAYGGQVGRNPHGPTAGVVPVGWSDAATDDALLGRIARRSVDDSAQTVAVHHNSDVATRLPDGVALLAEAPDGSPEAVRFAPSVWGVQCHPEADAGLVRLWERVREGDPDPVVVAEVLAAEKTLVETWRPLATALTDLAHARRAARLSEALDLPEPRP